MTSQEDIDEQLKLLQIYRVTLQHYLQQQAQFSELYAPPHITHGINDARANIQRIKGILRDRGIQVEDLPDDEAPPEDFTSVGRIADFTRQTKAEGYERKLPPDSGGDLLDLPDYEHYYPTVQAQAIIKDIFEHPGYHLIEAGIGMGKTALVRYLWKTRVPIRPIILQLFSHDHRLVSIQKALSSLHEQYLDILKPGPEKQYQGRDLLETLNNLLRLSTEQGLRLLILIDGIDESDPGERKLFMPQLLPNLDIVDRFKMTTIVVTTRLDAKRNVLDFLPSQHPLHRAHHHTLQYFTYADVNKFITEELKIHDDGTITQRVFDLSNGYPFSVHELCEITVSSGGDPAVLAERPQTPTMDRVWEHNLRDIEQSPVEDSQLLRSIISLTAAAKSGLKLEDIIKALNSKSSAISTILDNSSRYFPRSEDGYVLLNEHFRNYVSKHEQYRAEVAHSAQLLLDWVRSYVNSKDMTNIPLYVLRHAAEYLADTPDLRQLFVRRAWFEELQARTQARTSCKDAVLRAWTAAELAMSEAASKAAINTQAVNVIACALMQVSFTASLLPELILKVVELGFWTKEEARDYASFCQEVDRETVMAALDLPRSRIDIPEKSKAADALKELLPIANLKGSARTKAFTKWLRTWEQVGTDETQRLDSQNLVRQIVTILSEPAESFADEATQDFQELYERLQQYLPPPTGEISDEYFALLTSLQVSWQQIEKSVAQQHLSAILRPIARGSRASLLGALDILAPALAALFPAAAQEIGIAIESIVNEYL